MQLTSSEIMRLKKLAKTELKIKLKFSLIRDGIYRLDHKDCPFFDFQTHDCLIYEQRPFICRMFPDPNREACLQNRDPYMSKFKVFIFIPTAKNIYIKMATAVNNWLLQYKPNAFSIFSSDASTAAQARNIGILELLSVECMDCKMKFMNYWKKEGNKYISHEYKECFNCGSKNLFEQFKSFTHILFWDSDVWFGNENILKQLWETKKDVISPVVYKRTRPHNTMFYKRKGDLYEIITPNGDTGIIEVDACSSSFLLVSKEVFKKVPPEIAITSTGREIYLGWFAYHNMLTSTGGEDFWFCEQLKHYGYKILGHTGVTVAHLVDNETPRMRINEERFQKVKLPTIEEGEEEVSKGMMRLAEFIRPDRGMVQIQELLAYPATDLALEYKKKVKPYEGTIKFEAKLDDFYCSTPHYVFDLYKWHQTKGRQKWTRYMEKVIENTAGVSTICDWGGGIGCDLINLRKKYKCTLAELNSLHLAFAKYWANNSIKLFGIEPLSESKLPNYDVILCIDVLEHIPRPLERLEYLVNHTNKLIFLSDSFFRNEQYPQHLEANLYLKGKLDKYLKEYGCKEVIKYPEDLPLYVGVK